MPLLILLSAAAVRSDELADNHWILRKKREGGSLWLVDKKKQPVMEVQGGSNNRVEQIPAGSVMDPSLRAKLQRFSVNARREVDDSKSLFLSSQGHYGILIEKTVVSPETPDYARTVAERAARPWPSGVNLDKEFAGYKPPFPISTTTQVTVYDREGTTVFSKQFSEPVVRIDIDDSQSPVWMQVYIGAKDDKSQPQLIELSR